MTNQTANLQETINNVLQQTLNNTPNSSILLWTNQNPLNSFILKKDGKRYLGLPRKDRKGRDYWKFKEISSKKSPAMDSVDKFQQRQEQAKNYGKSESNEQSN